MTTTATSYWLGEALVATGISLHAYVLMTNHAHLLLTPSDDRTVPNLLISLGRRYVQYINRTYRRTGTLWDGRYKSSLIQSETYLLCCQRYIELNPVRAAIVHDPAHYRWSSYGIYATGQANCLITPRAEYLALGTCAEDRRQAYRVFFRETLDHEATGAIRMALDQSGPLGNSRFHATVECAIGNSHEPRPRGRPRNELSRTSARPSTNEPPAQ